MKKTLAVLLAIMMLLPLSMFTSFADGSYTITFSDLPYDVTAVTNPRTDWCVNKENADGTKGYTMGLDYWFVVTNADGSTTEIKESGQTVSVDAGRSLEFTVAVADYVEKGTIRTLAFPTGETLTDSAATGEPSADYYITVSNAGTYGLAPTQNMTVCLSEYHLYNDGFRLRLPTSNYYTCLRVNYDPDGSIGNIEDYSGAQIIYDESLGGIYGTKITKFKDADKTIVYNGETIYVAVVIPKTDAEGREYNYNPVVENGKIKKMGYKAYISRRVGDQTVTTDLKTGDNEVDKRLVAYEAANAYIDVYQVDNVDKNTRFMVTGTMSFNFQMLREFINELKTTDFSLEMFEYLDVSPIVEWFTRLIALITKIIAGFTG